MILILLLKETIMNRYKISQWLQNEWLPWLALTAHAHDIDALRSARASASASLPCEHGPTVLTNGTRGRVNVRSAYAIMPCVHSN